ncbi:uncharacterized protein [Apostichopus japonicus]|uniref:uncharacterized protein isoform X1 n=1 Tax=Stichopus japonicus TaxID=307972 RepID=UPI003AB73672
MNVFFADSKPYSTDEFLSPSTISGKNIKQLKVASDDKEKYDGCIAKDNEQDKEIYEIDDLFTVCSESVKDMSGKSKTCLPGNEKDIAGKIYDLVEASVTEISEKSDNANENTDHAYDRIEKSEKEKRENISKKGARRKNYDKLNTLRLQTK